MDQGVTSFQISGRQGFSDLTGHVPPVPTEADDEPTVEFHIAPETGETFGQIEAGEMVGEFQAGRGGGRGLTGQLGGEKPIKQGVK